MRGPPPASEIGTARTSPVFFAFSARPSAWLWTSSRPRGFAFPSMSRQRRPWISFEAEPGERAERVPGGLGVAEAGMTGLIEALSSGAIDATSATAATMLTHLATLWWAVVVGAVALAILRRTRATDLR